MSIKSVKKTARIVEEYLNSIGRPVKHAQALEIVARVHGAKNWNIFQANIPEEPHLEQGTCRRCGSSLQFGYCTDSTCQYSDWPQDLPMSVPGTMSTDLILDKYGVRKRIRVPAVTN